MSSLSTLLALKGNNTATIAPRSLYPIAIEEVYATESREWYSDFIGEGADGLDRLLADSDGAAIAEYIRRRREALDDILLTAFLTSLMQRTVSKTARFVDTNFSNQMAVILGMDFVYTSDVGSIMSDWVGTNVALFENLGHEYLNNLSRLLLSAKQAGWGAAQFNFELGKLDKYFLNYRVNLIARDQMGNLVNAISKQLHTSNGINNYIWTTERDERVRGNPEGVNPKAIPSHWEMDRKICKWDDSTVYFSNGEWVVRTSKMSFNEPGVEPGCRCVPTPVIGAVDTGNEVMIGADDEVFA
jgi:hypothetical protein